MVLSVISQEIRITIKTTMGKNDFNRRRVTLFSFIKLNVKNRDSYPRSNAMLNNKKQIVVGNETGIIWLPYRRGAL